MESMGRCRFPVFAHRVCIAAAANEMPGVINHSVVCGGVRVRAGDLVLGDDDRMVVVPRDPAEGYWGLARRFSARTPGVRKKRHDKRT